MFLQITPIKVMEFGDSFAQGTNNAQITPSWPQVSNNKRNLTVLQLFFQPTLALQNSLSAFFPKHIYHPLCKFSLFQPFYLVYSFASLRSTDLTTYTPQDLEWVLGSSEFDTPIV